jgi:glutamine amidotransferase
MRAAIIDYGMGNVRSVANMLLKIGGEPEIVSLPSDVGRADRIILPGVGAFDNCVERLQSLGLFDALRSYVARKERPLLGICLGMQLLGNGSEEGTQAGFGWLDYKALHLSTLGTPTAVPIPHMGWNEIRCVRSDSLFEGLDVLPRFYFAHSYAVPAANPCTVATADHGAPFAACVRFENVFGVQFHPEKSHKFGF